MKINRIIAAAMALCVIGGTSGTFAGSFGKNANLVAYAAEEEEYKYVTVDDIAYLVYSDHAAVNMFDMKVEGNIVIPEKIEGVPVTVVRGYSMSGPYNATSIKLPDTIEIIEDCAFNHCDGLTSINIPANLKYIGARAFNGCSGIKEFKLPDGVETIGDYAFENCAGITEMTVPAKVKELGVRAFANCENLEKLTFKGADTVIAEELCAKDSKLSDITFAEGIWDFRQNALTDTPWLADQRAKNEADNNGLVIVNNTIVDALNSGENVVIPENIKYIGEYAFYNADNVSYITIPSNVEAIGKCGVAYCSAKEITIENGVKIFGEGAFRACTKVKEINVPDSVTSIGKSCFYDCESLESVKIPDAMTEIPDELFENCRNLKEFTINKNITKIGNSAFAGCYAITEMTVPETVKEIGFDAFNDCRGLKKAVIKAPIEALPAGIFCSTHSLESIELPSTLKSIEKDAFTGTNLMLLDIPEGVETISNWAFAHSNLRYMVMPKSLKELGDYAFFEAKYLERVKFLNQATEMAGDPLWCDVVGYAKSNAQAYAEDREEVNFILIDSDDDKNFKPNLSKDPTVKKGDVNGDNAINLKDVVMIRRYIAGGWGVELDENVADVNGDGTVNLKDVVMLRRYIAGGWDVTL